MPFPLYILLSYETMPPYAHCVRFGNNYEKYTKNVSLIVLSSKMHFLHSWDVV